MNSLEIITHSWPWYLTRSAGLISLSLLILVVLMGIGQVTGYTYRILEPIKAWRLHKTISLALIGTLFLHLFSLLFDRYQPFSLIELFLPLASTYRPLTIGGISLGSVFISLGIIGFYACLAIIISSLWFMKSKRAWKLIHFLAYLLLPCVLIHSAYIGTDMASPWIKYPVWVAVIALILGTISRGWHKISPPSD